MAGSERRAPIWVGFVFIAVGCFIAALGAGWLPAAADSANAPGWVLQLAGLIFALGGLLTLTDRLDPRLHRWTGFVLVGAMAVLFAWAFFKMVGVILLGILALAAVGRRLLSRNEASGGP